LSLLGSALLRVDPAKLGDRPKLDVRKHFAKGRRHVQQLAPILVHTLDHGRDPGVFVCTLGCLASEEDPSIELTLLRARPDMETLVVEPTLKLDLAVPQCVLDAFSAQPDVEVLAMSRSIAHAKHGRLDWPWRNIDVCPPIGMPLELQHPVC